MALKIGALRLQPAPQLTEVINFTVENDPVAGHGIVHGLMAKGREIENGEPAISEPDFGRLRRVGMQNDGAGVVRPAVRERLRCTVKRAWPEGRTHCHDSHNSTHQKRSSTPDSC